MTWRGVPEDGLVVVVAHREVLCVVPKRGYSVSIEIVHDQRLVRAVWATGVFHELVHEPVVEGLLLCVVVVDLVARKGLGAVNPGRVGRVGVVCEQLVVQTVYRRSISESIELRLPRRVLRVRVGTE